MSATPFTIENTLNVPSSVEFESAALSAQLEEVLSDVVDVVAPVWPLKDYVAVNPYAGVANRSFLKAREFLRQFSNCETLMPIEYYASEFRRGQFKLIDIETALAESAWPQMPKAEEVLQRLNSVGLDQDYIAAPELKPQNPDRRVRTVAEQLTGTGGFDWTEAIVEEVSKHCASCYDQGQAIWTSPFVHRSLFQSWRTTAQHDLNIEILGLKGFRKYVVGLPATPEASILHSLQQLKVPTQLWSVFLLCQLFSVPGWSAWAKYKASWADSASDETNDLVCLLAIRLAYDAALAQSKSVSIDWHSILEEESMGLDALEEKIRTETLVRYVLLRASEIAYRNTMLRSLTLSNAQVGVVSENTHDRKAAQMVFCIDVRSERIRRQLESYSPEIETFGFAGFFGMAFEYATLGQSSGNLQLPVLLKPQFKVCEGCHTDDKTDEQTEISERRTSSTWRSLWKGFQSSAVSCFTFVESAGLFSGVRLLRRTIGGKWAANQPKPSSTSTVDQSKFGPTVRDLVWQGITVTRQADMAEGMLRNLGLTKNFAKLVVFCGHACQTENNPLAASLDCGACGGHSGEPNARFAAMLLNQQHVRVLLAERGIIIPSDTYFLGALHNTTTDAIEFFDTQATPEGLQRDLVDLQRSCYVAMQRTQAERLPVIASSSTGDLLNRASDWSEVRPEWGLAGNAAFIVAPRSLTKNANLDARSFLHSYDYTLDPECKVLETIMTAPMVVAHWINMQYYASSVDHQHYGSGTKTVHNVVGGFGILSGNGGDLKTGLPWQSLHTGKRYQHIPMRLQVVIAAPREMIDRVIAKHQLIAGLFSGGWIHLVCIEESRLYRLNEQADWERIAA